MTRSRLMTRALGLALLGSLTLAVACENQPATKKKTEAPATSEPKADEPKDATATGDAGDAGACEKYKTAFCEATGATSQSCQAMGVVSGLMPPASCEAGLEDIDFTKKAVANMGSKCTELVAKLCKDLGEDTETCKMVQARTPQFPPEQCVAMLGSYDQVLAELKAQEAQNKPLSPELTKAIAATDAPSFGPADAKVTIVEFSDFQCPYCTRAASAVDQIKAEYKGKSVRVVFRNFPLSFHKEAHLTAQAALAANEQGKFWEYHDLVFKNQKALMRPDLEKYAAELKLDMNKFKAALDSGKYKAQVDADFELGRKVFVQGTPSMFINGVRVPNPTAYEAIKPMIDSHLSQN